ncbi:MAG: DegV family protein [Lachnospiraceae bacterium]|nr:DegV family protein [Lachnospiraceae bacterium]
MSIAIFTDTSSNLSKKYADENKVGMIPFTYHFEGGEEESCLDIENFDGKKYYRRIGNGELVQTSQITPQTYLDAFRKRLEAGEDVLFVSMSGAISGSYNSSVIAVNELREEFPDRKIETLDTKGAALGEGMIVMEAVKCRDAGMTIDQMMPILEDRIECLYQIFTVDSLKHLRRTGRLTGAAALVGSLLNIKPLLKGNEKGQIVSVDKARGNKKAIQAMAQRYDSFAVNGEAQTVCIVDSDNDEDVAYLIELLKRNHPPKEIIRLCYEPVTGSHVGPGAVALFFYGEKGVRAK